MNLLRNGLLRNCLKRGSCVLTRYSSTHEKSYPTDLSDAERSCLEGHLPTPQNNGRPRVRSLREILKAIC